MTAGTADVLDAKTAETAYKFLGETVGFWIQTGALFLSAGAAIYLISANNRDNRRRATIDLVIQQKQDADLQEAKRWILSMHEQKQNNLARFMENKESIDLSSSRISSAF